MAEVTNTGTTNLDVETTPIVTETSSVSKHEDESSKTEPVMSAEEQMAQMKVEMLKLKKAMDKATSEASSYKKQLREKQSADEIAMQEKAEREAEREAESQELKKENTVTKYEKNFLSLGYGEDLANKAAVAQYEGDTDALFDIQKKVMDAMRKDIKAELMKSMPTSPISNDTEVTITKAQFDKMGYKARVEFKAKYPKLYEQYAK